MNRIESTGTTRYSQLAQAARAWSVEAHRPPNQRQQAVAIVSISTMLEAKRFPDDGVVKVLHLLVCKLCGSSGDGCRCLASSPRSDCLALTGGLIAAPEALAE